MKQVMVEWREFARRPTLPSSGDTGGGSSERASLGIEGLTRSSPCALVMLASTKLALRGISPLSSGFDKESTACQINSLFTSFLYFSGSCSAQIPSSSPGGTNKSAGLVGGLLTC